MRRRFLPNLGRSVPENKGDSNNGTASNETSTPTRRARIKPKVGIVGSNRSGLSVQRKSQTKPNNKEKRSEAVVPSIVIPLVREQYINSLPKSTTESDTLRATEPGKDIIIHDESQREMFLPELNASTSGPQENNLDNLVLAQPKESPQNIQSSEVQPGKCIFQVEPCLPVLIDESSLLLQGNTTCNGQASTEKVNVVVEINTVMLTGDMAEITVEGCISDSNLDIGQLQSATLLQNDDSQTKSHSNNIDFDSHQSVLTIQEDTLVPQILLTVDSDFEKSSNSETASHLDNSNVITEVMTNSHQSTLTISEATTIPPVLLTNNQLENITCNVNNDFEYSSNTHIASHLDNSNVIAEVIANSHQRTLAISETTTIPQVSLTNNQMENITCNVNNDFENSSNTHIASHVDNSNVITEVIANSHQRTLAISETTTIPQVSLTNNQMENITCNVNNDFEYSSNTHIASHLDNSNVITEVIANSHQRTLAISETTTIPQVSLTNNQMENITCNVNNDFENNSDTHIASHLDNSNVITEVIADSHQGTLAISETTTIPQVSLTNNQMENITCNIDNDFEKYSNFETTSHSDNSNVITEVIADSHQGTLAISETTTIPQVSLTNNQMENIICNIDNDFEKSSNFETASHSDNSNVITEVMADSHQGTLATYCFSPIPNSHIGRVAGESTITAYSNASGTVSRLNIKRRRKPRPKLPSRPEQVVFTEQSELSASPQMLDISEISIASNVEIDLGSCDSETTEIDHPVLELPIDLIQDDANENCQKEREAPKVLQQRFSKKNSVKLVVSRQGKRGSNEGMAQKGTSCKDNIVDSETVGASNTAKKRRVGPNLTKTRKTKQAAVRDMPPPDSDVSMPEVDNHDSANVVGGISECIQAEDSDVLTDVVIIPQHSQAESRGNVTAVLASSNSLEDISMSIPHLMSEIVQHNGEPLSSIAECLYADVMMCTTDTVIDHMQDSGITPTDNRSADSCISEVPGQANAEVGSISTQVTKQKKTKGTRKKRKTKGKEPDGSVIPEGTEGTQGVTEGSQEPEGGDPAPGDGTGSVTCGKKRSSKAKPKIPAKRGRKKATNEPSNVTEETAAAENEQRTVESNPSQERETNAAPSEKDTTVPVKKKRGRPSKKATDSSKQKDDTSAEAVTKNKEGETSAASEKDTTAPVKKKRGRPRSSKKATDSSKQNDTSAEAVTKNKEGETSAAPSEKDTTAPVKKKRGRPPSSKKATDSSKQKDDTSAEAVTKKKSKRKARSKDVPTAAHVSMMKISDMAFYNPKTNPMKSSSEEEAQETIANAPSTQVDQPEVNLPEIEEQAEVIVDDAGAQQSSVLAPRVRIDADGNIVLDEESLLIRTPAGENGAENREVVFENANQTYKSGRRKKYMERWNKQDTLYFYEILSQIGTDFSLMATLFPKRNRTELKKKFKREEKVNRDLVEKALNQRNPIPASLFAELLEETEEDMEQSLVVSPPEDVTET